VNLRASADFRPGNVAALLEDIAPRAIAATTRAVAIVKASAQEFVPKRSGDLADSIQSSVELIGTVVNGAVEATVPYAAFVEYGTGIHGEESPHGELPLEGVPFTGSWVYDYKQQDWKGMPAQPYLRPALDTNDAKIMDAFAAEGFRI
jgi:HK97 gp10 family phage protein